MQPCTVYTCARIPSATERTKWTQQWSKRTQGGNMRRNQNVKMYLKTRMTHWTGFSKRALDQLWQKSSFSLTLQAYIPQNRWSFTIFLQEKEKAAKPSGVSAVVQLYSERGLGSGAGQVEAETASLAKVTFTSEQFISLGVREGIYSFYFHCSKVGDWRWKRDTVESWRRLRLGAQFMLLQ